MIFRDATRADVPAIVALLADDPLGRGRESAPSEAYLTAFDEIAANPSHQLIVGEDAGRIVACVQLTIL
ncbi:MAG: GNAT family N-acetyltransferase, partial [Paracoccaceae bacterium]